MKRHITALFALCFALTGPCAVASEGEQRKISYPPADQPLLLRCWMHGDKERSPFKEWPSLALYFPNGIGQEPLNLKVVDPHSLLEDRTFGFDIRTADHWSIFSSKIPPSGDQAKMMPQIMFLPPTGPANMDIAYIKDAEVIKAGPCLGMIGGNTQSAFDKLVSDPSSLDPSK